MKSTEQILSLLISILVFVCWMVVLVIVADIIRVQFFSNKESTNAAVSNKNKSTHADGIYIYYDDVEYFIPREELGKLTVDQANYVVSCLYVTLTTPELLGDTAVPEDMEAFRVLA